MEQYPLTKFMPSSFINGTTTTLVNDACLNVIFIGFGKVNKQLFLTSVANNQFTTLDNGKIKEKLVNYYIYDKEDVLNDLTLNHNYFRIEKELYQQFDNNTLDESDYLPRPNKIANTNFVVLDINDPSFYNSIKDVVCKNNTLTYIVVSYSNDLDNLDLTIKLSYKISEWNYNNIKLFVKISDDDIALNVLNSNHANYYNFTIFGNKLRTTCSFDKVIRSKFDDMAINRHMMYSLENFKDKDEYSVKLSAYNAWYNYTTVQRESNKYSILGIRYKLQLLGFDIDYEQSSNPDAKDIFLSIYEKDNKIIYNENNKVVYSVHNIENTTRYNLAYLEHLRWNAYMISRGMIPSPISLIKKGITKDFNQRIHSNITTMEGLYMYREILSKALNIPLIDADVIKYDYQVMDDVIRILYSNSLKIIKTCNK